MECFQKRKAFLYKYKDHLDFVLLTQNRSVSDLLIKETPDLPWNVDAEMRRMPLPPNYLETLQEKHTVADQNDWNYIESACNPYWTYDYFADTLDKYLANPEWDKRYGRWFFQNWSRNAAIMRIYPEKAAESIKKYLAATKIKRSFKISITTPCYKLCQRRLLREFNEIKYHKHDIQSRSDASRTNPRAH
jgi:hypothetical protein